MINICLPLHDRYGDYSKYVGVVICSILENTEEKICIYILHDNTLTKANKDNLKMLVEKYKQNIYFCEILLLESLEQLKSLKNFTRGTLFRLKITESLPQNLTRVIYLDADIVVNLNIKDLWEFDLKGKTIGASLDVGIKENNINVELNGITDYNAYFNTGILVIDLIRLRTFYNLFEMAVQFFIKYPKCILLDQDALNYILKDDVTYLPNKYNQFVWLEKEHEAKISNKIYHYTGGPRVQKRINDVYMDRFDELYFSFLFKTPWGSGSAILQYYVEKMQTEKEYIKWLQKILKEISGKRKVFWGTKGRIHNNVMSKFVIREGDYYVDNNANLWGNVLNKAEIRNPVSLCKENMEDVVIIITITQYNDVKNQLESYGYIENKNFFDGSKLLLENEDRVIV